ncbi:MAG: GNAT family N-acetyltransferase, partial [Parachlamydiales bacterium]
SILTNAGGPGVIATDALIQSGGKLSELSEKTKENLNRFLPEAWSHSNPVDILGDASAELFEKSLDELAKDPNSHGVLVILTPQHMTDPKAVALKIKKHGQNPQKPILASWMGASRVFEGIEVLKEAHIPNFEFPDIACRTFGYMWSYADNLKALYEVPFLRDELSDSAAELEKQKTITALFDRAVQEKRLLLDEYESKKVLEAFEIPTVPTLVAKTPQEAMELAQKIGFPVVVKLYSQTITHKTDVGGVKLNLITPEAVKEAFSQILASVLKKVGEGHFQGVTVQPMINLSSGYELILGSSIDPQFGPVILFGTGGQLVEVFEDSALALPPLNANLAQRVMKKTKIYKALKGVRGRQSADLDYLTTLLIRFSRLIAEFPQIKEFDINPLWVSAEKIYALDARITLHAQNETRPELAIPAYPTQYIRFLDLKGLPGLTLRPITPEDEPLFIAFLQKLSKKAIYERFLKDLSSDELTRHDQLIQSCFCDYDRRLLLAAEIKKEQKREFLGVARLIKKPETKEGFFALVVKDEWQNRGLGSALLKQLVEIARAEKLKALSAWIFSENLPMQKLCTKTGFKITPSQGKMLFASLKLD